MSASPNTVAGRNYLKCYTAGYFEEQKGILWHQHKQELDKWHGPFMDDAGRQSGALTRVLRKVVWCEQLTRVQAVSSTSGSCSDFSLQKPWLYQPFSQQMQCAGHRYFVNSEDGISSWQDPRIDAQQRI